MIPKVIHYCWFGRNPLPKSAKKCVSSWKKFMPDYEIKEWNEDNFDVNIIPYTHDAYEAKKYAFVSDYARFWILYHYGGVYFDTDVEVIRPMDDLIEKGAFMGWEAHDSRGIWCVNPGLGLAAPRNMTLYKEILNRYELMELYEKGGRVSAYTMIPMIKDFLVYKGIKLDGSLQEVGGVYIYPSSFFNPMDSVSGKIIITRETRSIHWYSMSWMPKKVQWKVKIMRTIRRILNH